MLSPKLKKLCDSTAIYAKNFHMAFTEMLRNYRERDTKPTKAEQKKFADAIVKIKGVLEQVDPHDTHKLIPIADKALGYLKTTPFSPPKEEIGHWSEVNSFFVYAAGNMENLSAG